MLLGDNRLRSPPLERLGFAQRQHPTAVCRGGGLNTYQYTAADGQDGGGAPLMSCSEGKWSCPVRR